MQCEGRTRRVIDEDEGKTRGRKERLRGHIGVRTRALSDGWTIGPPAEREYAVEPVGVDTMRPSDWGVPLRRLRGREWSILTTASVRCCSSTKMSIVFRCGLEPRCNAISFITCQSYRGSDSQGMCGEDRQTITVLSNFNRVLVVERTRQTHPIENCRLAVKHTFQCLCKIVDV
jgi:hypothetical protein